MARLPLPFSLSLPLLLLLASLSSSSQAAPTTSHTAFLHVASHLARPRLATVSSSSSSSHPSSRRRAAATIITATTTAPLFMSASPPSSTPPSFPLLLKGGKTTNTHTPTNKNKKKNPLLGPLAIGTAAATVALLLTTFTSPPALAAAVKATINKATQAHTQQPGEHLHIGQRLANKIRSKTGWPDWVILMVISALPVVELRGGVPVGLWMGLPPTQTFALACIGNFLPVPFILLALNNIPWLMDKVTPRLEKKMKDVTGTKMNWQALAVFVGVPLPGTGAWTGAAIAALFKLSYAESILGVVAGIVSAGLIMTTLVLAGVWGAVGVGAGLLVSLAVQQWGKRRK